jgi:hypothetical protein
MELEIVKQLKLELETIFRSKIEIFENLTGLKIAVVSVRRVHEVGGDYTNPTLKVALNVEME